MTNGHAWGSLVRDFSTAVPAAVLPHWTRRDPAAWKSHLGVRVSVQQRPEVKRRARGQADGNTVASAPPEEISIILTVAVCRRRRPRLSETMNGRSGQQCRLIHETAPMNHYNASQ